MRRLDELSLRLMDGPLTPVESEELDGLIADPDAEGRFLQLMEVHHGLAALAPEDDVAGVIQAVWRSEASHARLRVRRRLAPRRRRRSGSPAVFIALAAAALLALGLGFVLVSRPAPVVPNPAPSMVADPVPTVPTAQPLAIARFEGVERGLGPGYALRPAVDGRVDRVGDATGVALAAGSELEVLAARRWRLGQGHGLWTVAPQPVDTPFVIVTPHAEVTVLGTAFSLAVEPDWSEIRMQRGRVRLANLAGTEAAELGPDAAARIGADGTLTWLTAAAAPPQALARWDFASDGSDRVVDRSGNGFDLLIEDPDRVERVPDGLRLLRPVRLRSVGPAHAITRALAASDAFTIVADLTPGRLPPDYDVAAIGTARILTISRDAYERNLTLGQGELQRGWGVLALRLRGALTGGDNGLPAYVVPEVFDEGRRVRLILTYDLERGLRVHQDGVLVAEEPGRGALDLWDEDFALSLGAEHADDGKGMRGWLGTFHALAIYDRALAPELIPPP